MEAESRGPAGRLGLWSGRVLGTARVRGSRKAAVGRRSKAAGMLGTVRLEEQERAAGRLGGGALDLWLQIWDRAMGSGGWGTAMNRTAGQKFFGSENRWL